MSTEDRAKSPKERCKLTHETREKAAEEATRMIHALAYAVVENLRSAADVIKVVADEAQRRNEKSLDIPRRALDKFYEVYQEPVHEQA